MDNVLGGVVFEVKELYLIKALLKIKYNLPL